MAGATLQPVQTVLYVRDLPDEAATTALAEDIGALLGPGDLVALSGDLGAGKSTLVRALLRARGDDPALEVPSPTFTLVQTYDLPGLTISHFDLYRLEDPEEVFELGLEEGLETGAALVEWPEQAGDLLPAGALWLRLEEVEAGSDARRARFWSTDPAWQARLSRSARIRDLIADAGLGRGRRRYLAGDASTRRYERVHFDSETAVLMDWPEPEGAAASAEALAYNRRVHRAPGISATLALTRELRRRDLPAPRILASDVATGLLLQEDFGDARIAVDGTPVPERYEVAVLLLAEFHSEPSRTSIALPEGDNYTIPVYSEAALILEAELFLDWYLPGTGAATPTDAARADFRDLWRRTLQGIAAAETGIVLRDYHSPNILWREDESGLARLGLIDYQDAVIGPLAYDLGSLTFDARVSVDKTLEKQLLDTYLAARASRCPEFDVISFENAYAVMAAQRIFKILGLFHRLAERDGKPVYLGHVPRMTAYLDRLLAAPALEEWKQWYETVRS